MRTGSGPNDPEPDFSSRSARQINSFRGHARSSEKRREQLRRLLVERSDDKIQRRQDAAGPQANASAELGRDLVETALVLGAGELEDT